MLFGSAFDDGQHVTARRNLDGWLGQLGYPVVYKGTRGIVRSQPPGWFSDRYLVEFSTSSRITVAAKDLKPALFGHGDAAFRRHQRTRQGVQLGMLILALPGIFGLVRYYASGGNTAGLVAAMPAAIVGTLGEIVATVGIPVTLLLLAALWLRSKLDRR